MSFSTVASKWLRLLLVAALAIVFAQSVAADDIVTRRFPSESPSQDPMPGSRQEIGADKTLAEVWTRLDRLENQNAELVRQNTELRSLVEATVALPGIPNEEAANVDDVTSPGQGSLLSFSYTGDDQQLGTTSIAGIESLQSTIERLRSNLTVTTVNKDFNIALFGGFSGELVFADARPFIPSAVTRITRSIGRNTNVAEVHGKSSYLGAMIAGPRMGEYQIGGQILAFFYGENVLSDRTGLFFARGNGELKSRCWRFAIGLDNDIVNPLAPDTINFVRGAGTGNLGYLRGQFRVERFFHLGNDRQWTAQFALSDPVVTTFSNFDATEGLTEDNGWPNVEARLAFEAGPPVMREGGRQRPFGIGVSGLVGQLRTISLDENVVSDVWAVGGDIRVPLTEWLAVKGEVFHGQAIGTYNGAVVQNFTLVTREGIRSTGGWGEVAIQWTPCLHSHFGGGIDDPRNENLAPSQVKRNEFCFANIIWDVTEVMDIGFEVSYRETSYVSQTIEPSLVATDNNATIYRGRVRIKF
jgi:hypothetical protein